MTPAAALALPEVAFLDVGDTLIRAEPSWAAVYLEALRRHGIELGEEELARALAEAGPWVLESPFETTEEAAFERILAFDARVLAAAGHPDLPTEVFRDIEAAFAARASWYLFPDVVPCLEALRDAGVRLAVISNWVWSLPQLLHDLELAATFERLIVSARVGYQKPHQGIFDHALSEMAVPAERTIHVGDSYEADVVGARSVGIRPVLIDRRTGDPSRPPSQPQDGDAVPVIRDFFELLDLVGVRRPEAAMAREA